MTFMVNQDGIVYEQDLGPDTATKAAAITTYNPDHGLRKGRPDPALAKPQDSSDPSLRFRAGIASD